jgi:hypothetical protein
LRCGADRSLFQAIKQKVEAASRFTWKSFVVAKVRKIIKF